jgi:hypothetical protein
MNATIIIEVIVLAVVMAVFLTSDMEAPANAMGPSGKCYLDCTGGGFPGSPLEHNRCLSACLFGEGVQRLDDSIVPANPRHPDLPKGHQSVKN